VYVSDELRKVLRAAAGEARPLKTLPGMSAKVEDGAKEQPEYIDSSDEELLKYGVDKDASGDYDDDDDVVTSAQKRRRTRSKVVCLKRAGGFHCDATRTPTPPKKRMIPSVEVPRQAPRSHAEIRFSHAGTQCEAHVKAGNQEEMLLSLVARLQHVRELLRAENFALIGESKDQRARVQEVDAEKESLQQRMMEFQQQTDALRATLRRQTEDTARYEQTVAGQARLLERYGDAVASLNAIKASRVQ
jgi:hypothetical protein